jgi:hypothetical protein
MVNKFCSALLVFAMFAPTAGAQSFPDRPVRILVG